MFVCGFGRQSASDNKVPLLREGSGMGIVTHRLPMYLFLLLPRSELMADQLVGLPIGFFSIWYVVRDLSRVKTLITVELRLKSLFLDSFCLVFSVLLAASARDWYLLRAKGQTLNYPYFV